MVSSRTTTALAGVVLGLALSAALWYYFDSLLFFLFVPFVPFLFRGSRGHSGDAAENRPGPAVAECPTCGYRTTDPEHDYCPRDGTGLERPPSRRDRRG